MFGLVFTDPRGKRVHEVPTIDRPLTVGRAADVDLSLPFKAVSRYHARFFSDGQSLYVEDLGSSNGVLVGGLRISGPTLLRPGAQARIGVIDVLVTGPPGWQEPEPYTEPGLEDVPTDPKLRTASSAPMVGPFPDAAPEEPGSPPGPSATVDPPTEPNPLFLEGLQTTHDGGPFVGHEPSTIPEFELPASVDATPEPPTEPHPSALDAERPLEQPPWAAGAAPPPLEASAAVEADAGASTPIVEPSATPDESTVALPVVPRLIGQSGYVKDKVFYLDTPEFTIGRVKGTTLTVEDASISRNHAKILHQDDSFVLFDLRSFNGTFVNNEQITRVALEGGETVRFGDIAFTFLVHGELEEAQVKKQKPGAKRRRRLILLSSAAVVLAAIVAAANILRDRNPPPPPPDPQAEQRALEANVRRQLERANTELRRRDWDAATTTLNGVLKLDPINADAVRGLEDARHEGERKGWLDEAGRVIETGRDLDRAKSLIAKIPEDSAYYADSRIRLRRLKRTIAEEARNLGLSYCRAWRWEECQRELCRFFQSWPPGEPIPDEVRVRRALERAETTLQRRRRSEFEPCQIPTPGTGDAAADAALAERYTEERIRGAVISYFQGRADDGIRTLGALEKRRQYREHRETISRLIEQMIRVQNASADAHRDVRGGGLEDAERSFETLKRADSRIIPSGVESRYVRQAAKMFGDAYHEEGQEHMRSGRIREAFRAWSKGKALSPHHPQILQSLMVLETRAREACQAARERMQAGDRSGAASHFELCRDITPETGAIHQGAIEALRQLGY